MRPWENTDVQPCGTMAAVRRHRRKGQIPLAQHCRTCHQAEQRHRADRYAAKARAA